MLKTKQPKKVRGFDASPKSQRSFSKSRFIKRSNQLLTPKPFLLPNSLSFKLQIYDYFTIKYEQLIRSII